MEIGTGIFLGMAFLGIVALYISTRDRWKWRRIVKKGLVIFCAIPLVVWCGIAATTAYNNRIVSVHTYQGLDVTDSKSDVRLKKGTPTEVSEDIWGYTEDDKAWDTVVMFSGEHIRAILYGGNCTYCNTLNGVAIGASYNTVIEKLGQPTVISTSKDGLSRYLSFKEALMVVRMELGQVTAVGIYNSRVGPPEFSKLGVKKQEEKNVGKIGPDRPSYDSKGWTQESTGSTEVGPWLTHSPLGTRYYRDSKRIIYRVFPPGVHPDAESANQFGLGDSTAGVPQ